MDHLLFSTSASYLVRYVDVVCSGANLSDHLPLSVFLDCQLAMSSSVVSCPTQTKQVAWYKVTTDRATKRIVGARDKYIKWAPYYRGLGACPQEFFCDFTGSEVCFWGF